VLGATSSASTRWRSRCPRASPSSQRALLARAGDRLDGVAGRAPSGEQSPARAAGRFDRAEAGAGRRRPSTPRSGTTLGQRGP
jgi:hypothetical protein